MRQLADYQLRYLVQCLAVNAAMICVTREFDGRYTVAAVPWDASHETVNFLVSDHQAHRLMEAGAARHRAVPPPGW
jgi:hypothetical protein